MYSNKDPSQPKINKRINTIGKKKNLDCSILDHLRVEYASLTNMCQGCVVCFWVLCNRIHSFKNKEKANFVPSQFCGELHNEIDIFLRVNKEQGTPGH